MDDLRPPGAMPPILPHLEDLPQVITREALSTIQELDQRLQHLAEEEATVLANAAERAAQLEAEARARGYAEGQQEWLQKTIALKERARALSAEVERDLVATALALASRMIRSELQVEADHIHPLVEACLEEVAERSRVVVRVHPEDAATFLADAGRYEDRLRDGVLHFVPDARLLRGDCVIDTERGRVDGRLEARLEMLLRAIAPPTVEE